MYLEQGTPGKNWEAVTFLRSSRALGFQANHHPELQIFMITKCIDGRRDKSPEQKIPGNLCRHYTLEEAESPLLKQQQPCRDKVW